jgi:hypothetical protein
MHSNDKPKGFRQPGCLGPRSSLLRVLGTNYHERHPTGSTCVNGLHYLPTTVFIAGTDNVEINSHMARIDMRRVCMRQRLLTFRRSE